MWKQHALGREGTLGSQEHSGRHPHSCQALLWHSGARSPAFYIFSSLVASSSPQATNPPNFQAEQTLAPTFVHLALLPPTYTGFCFLRLPGYFFPLRCSLSPSLQYRLSQSIHLRHHFFQEAFQDFCSHPHLVLRKALRSNRNYVICWFNE